MARGSHKMSNREAMIKTMTDGGESYERAATAVDRYLNPQVFDLPDNASDQQRQQARSDISSNMNSLNNVLNAQMDRLMGGGATSSEARIIREQEAVLQNMTPEQRTALARTLSTETGFDINPGAIDVFDIPAARQRALGMPVLPIVADIEERLDSLRSQQENLRMQPRRMDRSGNVEQNLDEIFGEAVSNPD